MKNDYFILYTLISVSRPFTKMKRNEFDFQGVHSATFTPDRSLSSTGAFAPSLVTVNYPKSEIRANRLLIHRMLQPHGRLRLENRKVFVFGFAEQLERQTETTT